jgi:chitodextrinase
VVGRVERRSRLRAVAIAAAAVAVLAAAVASTVAPAAPATLTRTPVADAYVRADQPGANFGAATTLRADGSPILRSYLRFSVPALPGPVTRALLRLRSSSSHAAGYRISGVADTGWGEGAITFATAPAVAPAPVGSSGALTAGGWSEVDVTPLVSGSGLVSMALTTTSATAMTLSSREAASSSRPQLVISTGDAAPDTTAPSVPAGLAASAAGPGAIVLSWSASTDAVGVAGYGVYRDGALVGATGGATSFTDGGLAPGSAHVYAVDAVDAAGNRSARSAAASATVAAGPSGGAPITRTPVADGYVVADQPGASFGSATSLRADGSPTLRSYLRFSVPDLPGTVTRALLRLRSSSSHAAGYRVSGVADTSWSEGSLTFAGAPALAPAPVGSSGSLAAGGWSEVDVTPLVSGSGLVSMALTTTSTTALTLSSREAAAASRPQLVITAGAEAADDPVIAAAGDIACDPADASFAGGLGTVGYCRQQAISDLLVDAGLAAVLPLGDLQYFCASPPAFRPPTTRAGAA